MVELRRELGMLKGWKSMPERVCRIVMHVKCANVPVRVVGVSV